MQMLDKMPRQVVFILLLTLSCLAVVTLAQTAVQSTCSRIHRNPPPTGKICGKYGTLKSPQTYATLKMPTQSGDGGFDFYWEYCADQCQEYDSSEACGSFSIDIEAEVCKLYRQDLSTGFTKKKASSGPFFYENACAKYLCQSTAVEFLTNAYNPTDYDDESWLVTIPFMLRFGANSYNQIWISMNGFISFGAANAPGSAYANTNFATSSLPPTSLAVFWDDLEAYVKSDPLSDTPFTQQVTYGYSPSEFTVTWDLRIRDVADGYVRAQLYLPGDQSYGIINYNFVDTTNGSSATIGLQADGSSFTYSYNTASIKSGLSLFVSQTNLKLCDDDSCI